MIPPSISSQMNHQWTNWGMSQWICRIYWGCTSLWTSLWLPKVTQENQMVGGHGMFGHWNTRAPLCFLSFSPHLVCILSSDFSRPLFALQDVKYTVSVSLNICNISGSPLFCKTSESWSADPYKNRWYITSSRRYMISVTVGRVLKLLALSCICIEIPHTKAIYTFFLYPHSISQLVILHSVYFNWVEINEPQWLKQICKYCLQMHGAGSLTDYL